MSVAPTPAHRSCLPPNDFSDCLLRQLKLPLRYRRRGRSGSQVLVRFPRDESFATTDL
ncbi:hypothetical protein HDG33_007161 [Paraburkholderia sp. Cpub6]|nr:hypothetical protein [Paraburkholderia sp. Cpub6]